MLLPSSLEEVRDRVSATLSGYIGTALEKIGRQTVEVGPALFVQWPNQSITAVTVSGLGVYISQAESWSTQQLHDTAAISREWDVYLVQYRAPVEYINQAAFLLAKEFPLSSPVPLSIEDDDGNVLSQVVVSIKGASL